MRNENTQGIISSAFQDRANKEEIKFSTFLFIIPTKAKRMRQSKIKFAMFQEPPPRRCNQNFFFFLRKKDGLDGIGLFEPQIVAKQGAVALAALHAVAAVGYFVLLLEQICDGFGERAENPSWHRATDIPHLMESWEHSRYCQDFVRILSEFCQNFVRFCQILSDFHQNYSFNSVHPLFQAASHGITRTRRGVTNPQHLILSASPAGRARGDTVTLSHSHSVPWVPFPA